MKSLTTLFILLFTATIFAKTGIYMNIESGWSNQPDLPTLSAANAYKNQEDNIPVFRVGIGYLHNFNPTFGVGIEIGESIYSKTTYYFNDGSEFGARSSLLDFLAVFAVDLNKVDLFAKLGGNRHTITTALHADIQPEIVIGAGYNLTNHFAIILDYLHSFKQRDDKELILSKDDFRSPSLNAILAGIRITFF